ncbi:transmembrane protein 230-like [Artemia franciscana]|uniref:transmembrane protein 230-like n=1 Tax=Artemia franciscana TaxID=6661 RepID=UPI0032D9F31F
MQRRLNLKKMEDKTDGSFTDAQFEKPPTPIPWKAIVFATVLFVAGTISLIVGSLLVSDHIDMKYNDRAWPLIIIGILMFIPGAYHVYIACKAYKGCPGYSFEDIPQFD